MKKPAIKAAFLLSVFLSSVFGPQLASAQDNTSGFALGDITISSIFDQAADESDGEVLAASTEQQPEEAAEPAPAEPQPVTAEVAKGDTLSKIAAAHGTTWRRLFDANESIADPNVINPGEKIRVPLPDEQLASRPLPAPLPAKTARREVSAGKPTPVQQTSAPAVADDSVWDALARCESGGNWAINTGNGYYGGLQFLPSTWRAVGGTGLPHQHSREEQILRGQILQARSGWGQWPACTKKLGLR